MKKKIIYAILICIIIAGAIVIGTIGLKTDIFYSKNVRIDVYLGKEFNTGEIEQIVKEVFETDKVLIQKVEYFNDMFSATIPQNIENMDEKMENLKNKLNEKYETEIDKSNIIANSQAKIKLSSVLNPYIMPLCISMLIILVYVLIRFKAIGIIKTLALYILGILSSEAVYLSVLAICRVPINRLVIPIGLLIYVTIITIITAIQEKKLANYNADKKNK